MNATCERNHLLADDGRCHVCEYVGRTRELHSRADSIGRNGDKPDEANAQTRTPRDIVACKELSLLWAKELEPLEESETESLWGPFIFPGSNVLVSGDSGVGKTTLLYNWAVHAARGEEFVGITLPPPPARALHRLRDARQPPPHQAQRCLHQ